MDDFVELKTPSAPLAKEDPSKLEAVLVAEGIDLLAAFRSIDDAAVRKSVVQMVSKMAAALHPSERRG